MSTDTAVAPASTAPASPAPPLGPWHCVTCRADGVYLDRSAAGPARAAAVESVIAANNYFAGLDYPALMQALYDCDAPRQCADGDGQAVRFADAIEPFDPRRRALYRAFKISNGEAEYFFEPVYLDDPDDPDAAPTPARLTVDEFIADMWSKGIRFGIDLAAVSAAIGSGLPGRVVVARRRPAVPGQDARVIEVSDGIHRSDAPRQLPNGKLDLMAFQNRYPQVQSGVRLLKKIPRAAGVPGYELSGIVIEPAVPRDLDLSSYSGPGTAVECTGEGDFLVAQQTGYLSVERGTSRLSVGDKVVSHDGVSAKTTGNLQLPGDFEEFGEVQENRVLEGDSITVHSHVFGHVISRGGSVRLNANLIGGSARNRSGSIRVGGVASGAVIQASGGEVVLEHAENCIVSGARVRIGHAVNCDILGEQVDVGVAEGCVIGGMQVTVGSATPRRQCEMVVIVMHPDCSGIDDALAQVRERLARFDELIARHKAHIEHMSSQPEVSKYMLLASRVRRKEITLTPQQLPQFQKLALAVTPALKAIAQVSQGLQAAEAERHTGLAVLADLERQRAENAAACAVHVGEILGDTQVLSWAFYPDGSSIYDLGAREVKARLRGGVVTTPLFSGSRGSYSWHRDDLAG